MGPLRRTLIAHPALAAALLAVTLLLRLLVPSGYMADISGGRIVIELCSGYGPQTMAMPMPGMDHDKKTRDHGKAEMPCAFSGLAMPPLAGADPLLLAVAIAFIVATVFRTALRPAPVAILPHLRPPLRGPPAQA